MLSHKRNDFNYEVTSYMQKSLPVTTLFLFQLAVQFWQADVELKGIIREDIEET